jgi:hypothetical protein
MRAMPSFAIVNHHHHRQHMRLFVHGAPQGSKPCSRRAVAIQNSRWWWWWSSWSYYCNSAITALASCQGADLFLCWMHTRKANPELQPSITVPVTHRAIKPVGLVGNVVTDSFQTCATGPCNTWVARQASLEASWNLFVEGPSCH